MALKYAYQKVQVGDAVYFQEGKDVVIKARVVEKQRHGALRVVLLARNSREGGCVYSEPVHSVLFASDVDAILRNDEFI